MSELRQQALALAAKGFHVFPIAPGAKAPALIKGFPTLASRDPNRIGKWWARWPDANIGISTSRYGDDKALLVVDIDTREDKNGEASVFTLETQGLEFPATAEQRTASGGRHLLFVVDAPCKQGTNVLGRGIDTRSSGGYIVGAGSALVGGGRYTLLRDTPLAPAPEWLVERCGRARSRKVERAAQQESRVDPDQAHRRCVAYLCAETTPVAVEGLGGDETTFKVAARCKNLGATEEQCLEWMLEYWNDRCSPAWDAENLATKVRNAYAYSQEGMGSAAPEVVFDLPAEPYPQNPLAKQPTLSPFELLNRDYAWIIAGGSDSILWETTDANGRFKMDLLPISTFHNRFASWDIYAGGKDQSVTKLWMRSDRRRQYPQGLCFKPGLPTPNGFYNLWRGFTVKPESAEPTPESRHAVDAFYEHARVNVCGNHPALFRWLMGYFAHIVQHPAEKPLVALVFVGGKGVGKNALVERIGQLLGRHFVLASDRRYLLGNFNSLLEQCLVFALDEAFWSGDKHAEGRLKDLITGADHLIERKNKEPYAAPNLTRVMIMSNEDWVIPASADERRFAVFNVGEGRKQDTKFFEDMRVGMERGGYALLLKELLEFDLTGINVNVAPITQGLLDQKHASLSSVHQWWLDCLTTGVVAGVGFDETWPEAIDVSSLLDVLARHMRSHNVRERQPPTRVLGKVFKTLCPGVEKSTRREGAGGHFDGGARKAVVHVYRIPKLADCRAAWDRFIGQPVDWEGGGP